MKREEITVHTEDKKSFQKHKRKKRKLMEKIIPMTPGFSPNAYAKKEAKKRYSGAK